MFDPKTASPEEFEAEARRLHALRVDRIQNMTPEEQQACAKFMMDGYLQRAATLRTNEIFTVEDLELQINKCVEIYRIDNFQSSAEYDAERERLVAADRQRKQAQAEEDAAIRTARANARNRWIAMGHDPSTLPDPDGEITDRDRQKWRAGETAVQPPSPRETVAQTRAEWEAMGQPNIMPVPGRVSNKFNYPQGATDEERWRFYAAKRDFLQSGLSWNSPEGRKLGTAFNRVEKHIEEAVHARQTAADVAEGPTDLEDLLEDIDEAIGFQRHRGNTAKVAMWERIRAAVETGNVPDDVRDRVSHGYAGARPGGRFYHVWKGAYNHIIGEN